MRHLLRLLAMLVLAFSLSGCITAAVVTGVAVGLGVAGVENY